MLVYVVKRGLLRNKGNVGVFPGLGWSNLLVREIESPSSALQLRCKTLSKPLFQTYFFVLCLSTIRESITLMENTGFYVHRIHRTILVIHFLQLLYVARRTCRLVDQRKGTVDVFPASRIWKYRLSWTWEYSKTETFKPILRDPGAESISSQGESNPTSSPVLKSTHSSWVSEDGLNHDHWCTTGKLGGGLA